MAGLCHVRREPSRREWPQAPTVRKERDEVSAIRHCPCSWATQRISVTDYEFHMFWGWNALWLCSTQEAATRNCQLGKLCGHEADLRKESSRQEDRC